MSPLQHPAAAAVPAAAHPHAVDPHVTDRHATDPHLTVQPRVVAGGTTS